MKTIYLNGQRTKLNASQLLRSGGEGMVFQMGNTAVKLYHQIQPRQRKKLKEFANSGLVQNLPNPVLGPCNLVHNKQQKIIGFQMPLLPQNSLPLAKLSQMNTWRQHNLSMRQVTAIFPAIHNTLNQLHQSGIVVGDLNDQNIFFTPPSSGSQTAPAPLKSPPLFWIDVDSYQFNGHPCPVAMLSFLDPCLYHVTDFSQRPYFTPLTDWYAFTVLLVKSLLQVHPYGGVHRGHKSLPARATAQVSILDAAVTYPKRARPLETLSDELIHHIHLTFDKGERQPFPIDLLAHYATSLTTCPGCHTEYPAYRSGCPTCRHISSAPPPTALAGQPHLLFTTDGFIEHVAVQPDGRILAIVYSHNIYQLIRAGIGGKYEEMVLFNGRPGYRFGSFGHYLVVNPSHRPHCLILDVRGQAPQQVTMIETAFFGHTAVFGTTQQHLYRIAGGWILRGSVRGGSFMEDPIATAHQKQTQFWASPVSEAIAGFHRLFAEHHFFRHQNGTNFDLPVPVLLPGESIAETAVAFSPDTTAVILKIGHKGRYGTHIHSFDHRGQLIRSRREKEDAFETAVAHYPLYNTTNALDDGAHYHWHPNGVIIQQSNALFFTADLK